tara:strand:+ start:91 stop:387 length:297 start_codon:yes stop_codon:yes gene_type:complete
MSGQRWPRAEVRRILGVTEEFLFAIEEAEIVRADSEGRYPSSALERIRICWNLERDLAVNLAGQEVVLHLLERVQRERQQFREVLGWLGFNLRRGRDA